MWKRHPFPFGQDIRFLTRCLHLGRLRRALLASLAATASISGLLQWVLLASLLPLGHDAPELFFLLLIRMQGLAACVKPKPVVGKTSQDGLQPGVLDQSSHGRLPQLCDVGSCEHAVFVSSIRHEA